MIKEDWAEDEAEDEAEDGTLLTTSAAAAAYLLPRKMVPINRPPVCCYLFPNSRSSSSSK